MEDTGGTGPPVDSELTPVTRPKKLIIPIMQADLEMNGKSVMALDDDTEMTNTIPLDNTDDDNTRGPFAQTNSFYYDESHRGPFIVYLDSYDANGMRKYLNAVAVSKMLLDLKLTDVTECIKVGFGRCKVTLKKL